MFLSRLRNFVKKIYLRFLGGTLDKAIVEFSGIETVSEDAHVYRLENYYALKKEKKEVAFFTAITGSYEDLKLPEYFDINVDYYVFTDDPCLFVPKPFIKVILDKYESDSTRLARWVKLNPHKLLSQYDYVIWVDSNILVKESISHYVESLKGRDADLGFFKHPDRTSVEEEILACKKFAKESCRELDRQYESYVSLYGYESINSVNLVESNVYIARLKSSVVSKFFEEWFYELSSYSKRDQISLPIAIIKSPELSLFFLENHREKIPRFNKNLFEIFRHSDRVTYQTPRYFNSCESTFFVDDLEKRQLEPKQAHSVSIIVTVFNALEEVQKLFVSLVGQNDLDFQLIIVDDASEVDTVKFLKQQEIIDKIIFHDVNLGYTQSVNDGVKASDNEIIVVLNSDTVLPSDFVGCLKKYATKHPNISAFGPVTNAGSWQNTPRLRDSLGKIAINEMPDSYTVDSFNSKMKVFFDECELVKVNLLNGFCYAVRKSAYEAVGLLDHESFPKGYGEEDDFFIRLYKQGFQAGVMASVYVYHHKTKSFTPEQKKEYSNKGLATLYSLHSKELVTRLVKNSSENPLLMKNREIVQSEFFHDKTY
ncbi:glycosyltransferase [Aurantibacter sp.]|uniref:glycosyltransferase n=1 Tax=Aurantibacter sp. TaxID=2807103 RepID=UPI0032648B0B